MEKNRPPMTPPTFWKMAKHDGLPADYYDRLEHYHERGNAKEKLRRRGTQWCVIFKKCCIVWHHLGNFSIAPDFVMFTFLFIHFYDMIFGDKILAPKTRNIHLGPRASVNHGHNNIHFVKIETWRKWSSLFWRYLTELVAVVEVVNFELISTLRFFLL